MTAVLAATRTLLDSLDPLPYRKRMNRLAEWAQTAPDRAPVCADLREQGPYERHLALVAAMVARDTDGIAAATRDPQPSIRVTALTAALYAGIPASDHVDRSARGVVRPGPGRSRHDGADSGRRDHGGAAGRGPDP